MSDEVKDFFVNDEENKQQEIQKSKKKDQRSDIVPNDYIKVKLSTCGKLSAPPIVHVRDYSGEEAFKLSLMNDDNMVETIIDVINNLLYEDFDAGKFHEREVEEILLNIHANFWDSTISYNYEPTEEELNELKESDSEKLKKIQNSNEPLKVAIPITNIETKPLPDNFSEPISIKDKNIKVQFILPRIEHILETSKYLQTKFAQEDQKFATLKQIISHNDRMKRERKFNEIEYISEDKMQEYNNYQIRRTREYILIQQSLLIKKINNQKLITINEKRKAYERIPQRLWDVLGNILNKDLFFGVQREVKVKSPLTNKKVTRRFQFRLLDFIPTLELQDTSGYTISFGE